MAMAPVLTIRNLTDIRISLKSVEQFEDVNMLASTASSGHLFTFKRGILSLSSTSQLRQHAQCFKCYDLDVTLAPFEAHLLNIPEPAPASQDAPMLSNTGFQVTVETADGKRFRVNANPSYTQKSTQLLMALSSDPSKKLSALFHPSKPTPHLVIHSHDELDYCRWMSSLSDGLPLSAISVPGTHNSHTHYRALPSVRCQSTDVRSQLDEGIRFLDIRVQPAHATDTTKKSLYLVHGAFPVSLTGAKYLEPVLQTCYEFLETNPSETMLISLKREGTGNATDEHLACILEDHYITPNAAKWHTGHTIPCLGDVRGKIVLLRRYATASPSPAFGLDATAWPDNATHALFPDSSSTFCLQDFYAVMSPSLISTKIKHCNDHLMRAAECIHPIPGISTDITNPVPPSPLHLNFLSASNFFRRACWPENIAGIINRGMEEWLCAGHHLKTPNVSTEHPDVTAKEDILGVKRPGDGDGGTGVVIMDYAGEGGDWTLVRLVIGMNMGVSTKIKNRN